MDYLGIVLDLAKALFGAFANAVTEYPLAAILALLITYAYLHDKGLLGPR